VRNSSFRWILTASAAVLLALALCEGAWAQPGAAASARAALELGADVVKLNLPRRSEKDSDMPRPYRELEWTPAEGARRVVTSARDTLVLFSGGSRQGTADALEKARLAMDAGASGLIFGRNMWQRPLEEALELTERVKELFGDYGVDG